MLLQIYSKSLSDLLGVWSCAAFLGVLPSSHGLFSNGSHMKIKESLSRSAQIIRQWSLRIHQIWSFVEPMCVNVSTLYRMSSKWPFPHWCFRAREQGHSRAEGSDFFHLRCWISEHESIRLNIEYCSPPPYSTSQRGLRLRLPVLIARSIWSL